MRLSKFLMYMLLTIALIWGQLVSEEADFKATVTRSRALIDAQLGFQDLAIGTYGPPALLVRLLEQEGRVKVRSLSVFRGNKQILTRRFSQDDAGVFQPITFEFKTELGSLLTSGIVVLNQTILGWIAFRSLLCVALLVLVFRLSNWYSSIDVMRKLAEERYQLASQLAHDIRSPLSALNLAISADGEFNEDRKNLITLASRRIDQVAAQLLKMTKAQTTSDVQLTYETALRNVQALSKTVFANKHIEFIIQKRCDLIAPDGFESVVSNLIQNAIDATQDNSPIEVELKRTLRFVQVTITDRGSGISEEVQKQIGKFGFTTKADQGNGIGLFMANRFATRNGGKLILQSKIGIGTSVHILIPKNQYFRRFIRRLQMR